MLDATRDCVLAVGVRRTTLTDVARRAGVSRMTIYRRWPDVRTLVADLMTREWASVVSRVAPPEDGSPVRVQAVEALVAGVGALRAHPLFLKIMEVDPEVLLPYILERRGTSQDAMLRAIEGTLRAGHRDGSVRAGDPVRQARSLLLVLQSFAMSGHTMTGDGPALSAAAFDEELRRILERYLAP
ncbi:TetR family transcriptional regulator [Actinoallomurus iriomotensis]|uniref:TetR family transcriptional regulator n=1 Tax=Actinoallomurus iriomotensis TaxID=478107 RepID=A0A9W6W1E1_9ACTN|nr:TetR family transcriptional regulator [Actinoallomurus iriomotensis]